MMLHLYIVTPLDVAAEGGHDGVVKILIDAEADPDIRKSDGATPLHLASEKGHDGVVDLLLSKVANPNDVEEYGTIKRKPPRAR